MARRRVVATSMVLAVIPLVYWQYQQHLKLKKRRETMKLLGKVQLVAAEVSERLMHLEMQTKELVEYESMKKADETEDEEDPAANSALNAYYHFDSQGNKLKTKWDTYDVDAELERLENEERGEKVSTNVIKAKKTTHKVPLMTRSKAMATSQGIEHELGAVLSFLDDIRGDEEVKQVRKSIVNTITHDYFGHIDTIQALLGLK